MKVLLSIRPEYVEKILSGEKLYEFRRAIFKRNDVKKVLIYASSPVKKVVGEFEIEYILSKKLDDLWHETKENSGIDEDFYYKYFDGKSIGHAIKIKNLNIFEHHSRLDEYNINVAPQSFAYV